MQIGTEVALPVVVINFAAFEYKMPNAEIEHTRVALGIAGILRLRQVRTPLSIDKHANYRMGNAQFVNVPTAVQERTDGHLHAKRVCFEQRRVSVGRRTMHHNIVEFGARTHPLPMERVVAELHLASQCLTRLFLSRSKQVTMKPVTVQQQGHSNHEEDQQTADHTEYPRGHAFPPMSPELKRWTPP